MISFFRRIFVFFYICFSFFIRPGEVFAYNIPSLNNNLVNHYISAQEEVDLYDETEHYFVVLSNNNTQISCTKNNYSNAFSGNECTFSSCLQNSTNSHYNILKYNIRFKYNYSKILKYTLNTRAP